LPLLQTHSTIAIFSPLKIENIGENMTKIKQKNAKIEKKAKKIRGHN